MQNSKSESMSSNSVKNVLKSYQLAGKDKNKFLLKIFPILKLHTCIHSFMHTDVFMPTHIATYTM